MGMFRWIDCDNHPSWRTLGSEDGWVVFTEFSLRYMTFAEVNREMSMVYQNSSQLAPVLNRVVISRYPYGRLVMQRDATFIRDCTLGISNLFFNR